MNGKEIDIEKACKNCRYFSQHYFKRNTMYDKVCCGHCLNPNGKNKKKNDPSGVCEYWEAITVRKEERKQSIKETIEFMCGRLNEMAMLLEDDRGTE